MNWYTLFKSSDKRSFLLQQGYSTDIVDWALSLDSKSAIWLAKMAKGGIVIPGEDDNKLTETLNVFKKHRDKLELKDINKYKSYEQLYLAVSPYMQKNSKRQQKKINQEEGAKEVLQDGNVKVIELQTEEAAAHLCRDTQWCITDPRFFQKYTQQSPLYMFTINDKPFALLNIGSNQLKNINDAALSLSDYAKIYSAYSRLYELKKDTNQAVPSMDTGMEGDLKVITEGFLVRKFFNSATEKESMSLLNKDMRYFSFIPQEKTTPNLLSYATRELEKKIKEKTKNNIGESLDLYNSVDSRLKSEKIKNYIKKSILRVVDLTYKNYENYVDIYSMIPNDLKDQNIIDIFKSHVISSLDSFDELKAFPIPKEFIDDSSKKRIISLIDEKMSSASYIDGPDVFISIFENNNLSLDEIPDFKNKLIDYSSDLLNRTKRYNWISAWPKFVLESEKIQSQLKNFLFSCLTRHDIVNSFAYEFVMIFPYLLDKDSVLKSFLDITKQKIAENPLFFETVRYNFSSSWFTHSSLSNLGQSLIKELHKYTLGIIMELVKKSPELYLKYNDLIDESSRSILKSFVTPYFEMELQRIANNVSIDDIDYEKLIFMYENNLFSSKSLFNKAVSNGVRSGYFKDPYGKKIADIYTKPQESNVVLGPVASTNMNWYTKIAAPVADVSRLMDDRSKKLTYLDIGHGINYDYKKNEEDQNYKEFVWWIDSKWNFYFQKANIYLDNYKTHDNLGMPEDFISCGRYEISDKYPLGICSMEINKNVRSLYGKDNIIERSSEILDKKFNNPEIRVFW